MDQITVKGIPIETLLKVYEQHSGQTETKHDRDKRYREAHKEEIRKKNREYYLRKKGAQAAPPDPQAAPTE